jgi:hypothetical protein
MLPIEVCMRLLEKDVRESSRKIDHCLEGLYVAKGHS